MSESSEGIPCSITSFATNISNLTTSTTSGEHVSLRIHLQNTKHLRWNNRHHPMCSAHLTEIDFEYHCCWQWNVSVAPHSPCRWPKTGHPCHPEKGSLCPNERQINDDSCAFMHNFVWFLITIYIGKGADSTCFNLLLPISNLPKTSEHQRSQLGPPFQKFWIFQGALNRW